MREASIEVFVAEIRRIAGGDVEAAACGGKLA